MVLRGVVLPLSLTFVLFLVIQVAHARTSRRRERVTDVGGGWGALVRHVAATAAGGYALFLLIVVLFVGVALGDFAAMGEALAGGGFLAAVAVQAFLLLSWAERLLTERRLASRRERESYQRDRI